MQINYNQLSENKKVLQFTEGCYPVEFNRQRKWIWTSKEFGGIIENVEVLSLTIETDLDNKLYYEDLDMDLNPDCLNIISLPVKGKKEFSLSLETDYDVPPDIRKLGVKIISVSVDGDVIF